MTFLGLKALGDMECMRMLGASSCPVSTKSPSNLFGDGSLVSCVNVAREQFAVANGCVLTVLWKSTTSSMDGSSSEFACTIKFSFGRLIVS